MKVVNLSAEYIKKLEGIQNKVGRIALGANGYVGVEAVRGDMGWSTFEERLIKTQLKYKIRLEKMQADRLAKKVYNHVGYKNK